MAGKVYFIGAGPGDPELITVKGRRLLGEADIVVYTDSLVSSAMLAWTRPGAQVYGSATMTLEQVMAVLVGGARAGKTVVRLHTGDPALFGAIQEQFVVLNAAGIVYEVVPGVTAAFGAAAALGAELTLPEVSQTVILSRIEGRTPVPEGENLRALAAHRATLVLYLSVAQIGRVVAELVAGGYSADTPVAVVQRATWPDQRIVRGTLENIAPLTEAEGIRNHALIMVGQVFSGAVPHRSKLYDGTFAHMFREAE